MTIDLLKVWKTGADLSEAWFHLAPSDQWRTFNFPEAARLPAKESLEWSADVWADADQHAQADLQKAVSAQFLTRSPSASRAAQIEMKSWLVSALRSGAMIGVGRDVGVVDQTELEIIPKFLFDPCRIGWENSSLEGGGRSFSQIKVAAADVVNALADNPSYCALGRPSKSDQVKRAIEELIAEGLDFNAIGRGEAERKILAYAKEILGSNTEKGFSTPVIRRALVARCGKLFEKV